MAFSTATLAFETRHLLRKLQARARRIDRRVVRLTPEGTPRGVALFSYVLEPLLAREAAADPSHTHFWESLQMAETLVELGFAVDAVSWTNRDLVPARPYDLVLDVRANLERWAPVLDASALRVLHCDTAHWTFNNAAEQGRLRALAARRGVTLRPRRQMPRDRVRPRRRRAHVSRQRVHPLDVPFRRRADWTACRSRSPLLYDWPAPRTSPRAPSASCGSAAAAWSTRGSTSCSRPSPACPTRALSSAARSRASPISSPPIGASSTRRPTSAPSTGSTSARSASASSALRSLALVYPSCSEGGGASVLPACTPRSYRCSPRDERRPLPSYGVLLRDATVGTCATCTRASQRCRPPSSRGCRAPGGSAPARTTRARSSLARFRAFAGELVAGSYLPRPEARARIGSGA